MEKRLLKDIAKLKAKMSIFIISLEGSQEDTAEEAKYFKKSK